MSDNVRKRDLIDAVAEKVGVKKTEAYAIVEGFFDSVLETLKAGNDMEFRNFGVFRIKEMKARKGRNPKTGESVDIPARKKVVFKAGKVMKELLK